MRKFILTLIAALATLGAVAAGPKQAEASSLAAPAAINAPVEMQYYYGGGYHGGYRRHHRPYYGYRRYAPPVYIAPPYYGPRCVIRQRWVETRRGLRLRNVRICR